MLPCVLALRIARNRYFTEKNDFADKNGLKYGLRSIFRREKALDVAVIGRCFVSQCNIWSNSQ